MDYNYDDFVNDFISRTMSNLKIIEQMENNGDVLDQLKPYKETQLINSFLGLIIIPIEKIKECMNNNSKLHKDKESELYTEMKSCVECGKGSNLFKILNSLRNGFAHAHFITKHNEHNVITSIKIWDEYEGEPNFTFVCDIEKLRKIVNMLSDYLKEK